MVIRKELKNATFEYDEEKKIFTIMEADGFNGYIELEQYHSVATRAYQLCQQVMFESIISGAK